jgi:SpoVK/Ycf46/Vps4 family AAA+-type ATPase
MLLIGPPGNGKTSLAEAVAEALQVPFYIVRYELLVGSYLGETSSRLQKLFERVASRHCVLFFDEFETLARERGSDNEVGEIKRVVSSLLMLIDRLPSHVVVIAASNHGKMLDYAVRRRFDVRIHLPAPDLAQVEKFLGEFERRTTVTFGMPVPEIAERIFRKLNNFAEIENFAVSVMRDYYLDNPAGGIRSIVERRIELADRCDIPDDCLAGRETPC